MSKREKYPTRTVFLGNDMNANTAQILLSQAPRDPINPLEMVLREQVKVRKPSQNDLMWARELKDISTQAYVQGRTYSDEVWHELFKAEYLPEEFDPELCKEGYRKWDMNPKGDRVLVGSTTQLTVKGFSIYLEQVTAYGASLGVMFSASPKKWKWRR